MNPKHAAGTALLRAWARSHLAMQHSPCAQQLPGPKP